MDDEFDKGFWLKLIGGLLLLGLAGFLVFIILEELFWGLGFLGGLLALAAILLVGAWLYDRRQERARSG